jgi:hypothetical protein
MAVFYDDEETPDVIEIGNGHSLNLLQAVYRNSKLALGVRIRAAVAALPHEFPKMVAVAQFSGRGDFGDRLDAMIQRSERAREVRVIEHQPAMPALTPPATTNGAARTVESQAPGATGPADEEPERIDRRATEITPPGAPMAKLRINRRV